MLKEYRVRFFWDEPDRVTKPIPGYDPFKPFAERILYFLPGYAENITLELKTPPSFGFSIFPTSVRGRVIEFEENDAYFDITLERNARVSLDYNLLIGLIGTTVVGFHQTLGRVEGILKGLLPDEYELAVIETPELNALERFICLEQAKEQELSQDEFDEIMSAKENSSVVISWLDIWTKEGLENSKDIHKKSRRRKRF